MKSANYFKLAMAAALVIGIGAVVSTDTKADTGTIGSTVQIGDPVVVTGENDLDWGVFAAPTSGTDTWVMTCSGGLTGTTPANDLDLNDHSVGNFTITGHNTGTVIYSVLVLTQFSATGVTLSNLTLCPASSQVFGSPLNVDVGGTLDITDAATSGTYTDAVIEMTADY